MPLFGALKNLAFIYSKDAPPPRGRNGERAKRARFRSQLLERLESRHLMTANPIAFDDPEFHTALNTDLVVSLSSVPSHLLANDFDIDASSFSTSVVAGPSNGTLVAFGTDGTFTYRPNTGFVGVDYFTYKFNDGSLDSNVATVTVAVGTKLTGAHNKESNVFLASGLSKDAAIVNPTSGELSFVEPVSPDQSLVFRSDALHKPIVIVETQLAAGVSPSSITAELTFNGVAGTTYAYNSSYSGGEKLRFALQADGSSLATGMYDYSVKVGITVSGTTTYQTFTGKKPIVNRTSSEYGAGWWLNGLDRLYDTSSGALIVRGNGDTLWFAKPSSTYQYAAGDVDFHALVKNGNNTFTMTSKSGIVYNFSTLGLLTTVVDTNSNTTTFAYADRDSDSVADELISITDPFGRVTNLGRLARCKARALHMPCT